MANQKMTQIAMEILKVMTDAFPHDHLQFMFGGLLEPGDIVEMVMLELIKNAYDSTEEKHSLRFFYEKYGITEMDQIMRYSRIQSYVMKWRKNEFDRRKEYIDEGIFEGLVALMPPNMSDMNVRLEGYKLTEMNFFELTTIMENDFSKAFTEKRLINTKKVSNDKFKEIISQFDNIIMELNERWTKSVEDCVFSSLAAFTLEWKYPINYIYKVAERMDKLGLSEFPEQKGRLGTFCGDIRYNTMMGCVCSTHSRMLTVRERYIELMIREPKESLLFEAEQIAFLEGLGIISQLINYMTMNDVPIKKWFVENTTKNDWASFFMDYDVFSHLIQGDKNWNNKKIRYFRNCLALILVP